MIGLIGLLSKETLRRQHSDQLHRSESGAGKIMFNSTGEGHDCTGLLCGSRGHGITT
jgi:hypothetical protein